MSKRNYLGFKYPVDKVLKAAQKKAKHHAARLKFYEKEMDAFVKLLKKRGLTLTGDSASTALFTVHSTTTYSKPRGISGYSGTSGYSGYSGTGSIGYTGNGQIMVEDALTTKLNFINGALRSHIENLKMFDKWAMLLEDCSEQEIELDFDDWHFFFGE
jgi:hypothetical protein